MTTFGIPFLRLWLLLWSSCTSPALLLPASLAA